MKFRAYSARPDRLPAPHAIMFGACVAAPSLVIYYARGRACLT